MDWKWLLALRSVHASQQAKLGVSLETRRGIIGDYT